MRKKLVASPAMSIKKNDLKSDNLPKAAMSMINRALIEKGRYLLESKGTYVHFSVVLSETETPVARKPLCL
jgi:hypothetical protein